ncbi:MAG: phage scaffolding protein [Clostridia bacterium]|nr:phage scaffolding protein [Clostridia bacterium]
MSEPTNNNPNQEPNTPTPAPTAPAPQVDPNQLAESLMNAIQTRTSRAETSVAKSFAEQYGMTEDEIKSILDAEKSKRAAQLPPEVQAQIDAANKLVISAEIKTLGSQMGLVDADAAMQLMDMTGVKLSDGKVTGAQEALDALKETKPYLFGAAQPVKAWGQRQGGVPPKIDGVEAAFYAMNPELKKE